MSAAVVPADLVRLDDGKLVTDSLKVAEVHHKRHDNVVQLIRKRVADAGDWGLLHFQEITYTDASGRQYPMFKIDRDGYAFLVAKLTGKTAVQHQIEFIEAFNAMATQLQKRDLSLWSKMQELIAQEVESEVRATFGSLLLNERKRDLPLLRGERNRLESAINPPLFDSATEH